MLLLVRQMLHSDFFSEIILWQSRAWCQGVFFVKEKDQVSVLRQYFPQLHKKSCPLYEEKSVNLPHISLHLFNTSILIHLI